MYNGLELYEFYTDTLPLTLPDTVENRKVTDLSYPADYHNLWDQNNQQGREKYYSHGFYRNWISHFEDIPYIGIFWKTPMRHFIPEKIWEYENTDNPQKTWDDTPINVMNLIGAGFDHPAQPDYMYYLNGIVFRDQ